MTTRPLYSVVALSLLTYLIFYFSSANIAAQSEAFKIVGLRTEYKENPLGIDARHPRLSWRLLSSQRAVMQSAYQIRVARNERDLRAGGNLVWDSGQVKSDESIHRIYAGPALESGRRYYWQARAWDASGRDSGWSEIAYFEMGLLDIADWKASWIEPDLQEDTKKSNPSPMLRREFKLNGAIDKARAYVTS